MILTKEILEKHDACSQGVKWFERTFPNGGELIDVINHKYTDKQFLHWGFANLTVSEEEKAAYYKKLNIDCGEANYTIYECDNIVNSRYVTNSSWVEDSKYIFSSSDVKNSNNILHGNSVENGRLVYGSDFIYDSEKIVNGKNINSSYYIINSDYVINSHYVYNAVGIKNSAYITGINFAETKQIKDSFFVGNSKNLDHCLFCFGIENQNYKIFNCSLDEMEYTIIQKQMQSILRDWEPEFVRENEWPQDRIPLEAPAIQRNIIKQFAGLPDKFWRWVKTLPGYDPSILYAITYNKDLL